MQLSDEGIYVGLGSACGSFSSNTNPLMQRLNMPNVDAHSYLRISQWGNYKKDDANYFLSVLSKMM